MAKFPNLEIMVSYGNMVNGKFISNRFRNRIYGFQNNNLLNNLPYLPYLPYSYYIIWFNYFIYSILLV